MRDLLAAVIRASPVLVSMALLVDGCPVSAAGAAPGEPIAKSEEFFPDGLGSRWRYQGTVVEGPLERIANVGFVNVSTVTGTRSVHGVTVTVFHDTNPGNHGPSDSFYRRDAAGIVYYGSEPGTELERQIIPYQIVRFPIQVSSSFQQFDRRDLDFGSDLDGDGVSERADAAATVRILGTERVTVPAGTYEHAVQLQAKMTLKIVLSGSRKVVLGTDTLTAWFARGVGLIKYVERQELPGIRSEGGAVSEITEVLESVELKAAGASEFRGEAPAQSILADHTGRHELGKIVGPAGFRANP